MTSTKLRRVNVRAILADPALRKRLMVAVIVATQSREGIDTSLEQATAAYEKVHAERVRSAAPSA